MGPLSMEAHHLDPLHTNVLDSNLERIIASVSVRPRCSLNSLAGCSIESDHAMDPGFHKAIVDAFLLARSSM